MHPPDIPKQSRRNAAFYEPAKSSEVRRDVIPRRDGGRPFKVSVNNVYSNGVTSLKHHATFSSAAVRTTLFCL